ncbi:MAG TPA: PP2C family protein-serine/threonine phosphatase, partial [Chlamydiales bacterium]|nr:PP2C family protein-serine/threonine phosphatase [Chlamydiales bacterium]
MASTFLNIAKQHLPADQYAQLNAKVPKNLALIRNYATKSGIVTGACFLLNIFARGDYSFWNNALMLSGVFGCYKVREGVSQYLNSQTIDLTKGLAAFQQELQKANVSDLSAYRPRLVELGREFNRLPKEERTPYLTSVMGAIFHLFKETKTEKRKEHLAKLQAIRSPVTPRVAVVAKPIAQKSIPREARGVIRNPRPAVPDRPMPPTIRAPGVGFVPPASPAASLSRRALDLLGGAIRSLRSLGAHPPGHKTTMSIKDREWRIKVGDKPDLVFKGKTVGADVRARRCMLRTASNAAREGVKPETDDERHLRFFADPTTLDKAHFEKLTDKVSRPRVLQSYTNIGTWDDVTKELVTVDKAPQATGKLLDYSYAVATHPGYKHDTWITNAENEDRHIANGFYVKASPSAKKKYRVCFFGLADGHGGSAASEYVRRMAAGYFEEQMVVARRERSKVEAIDADTLDDVDFHNALILTFLQLNKFIYEYRGPKGEKIESGTTLNLAMIANNKLFVANAGDTRAMMVTPKRREAPNGEIIQLSSDHKPENQRASIELRGGIILGSRVPRVDGILAVGRTVGDSYLDGHISARPSIS